MVSLAGRASEFQIQEQGEWLGTLCSFTLMGAIAVLGHLVAH